MEPHRLTDRYSHVVS